MAVDLDSLTDEVYFAELKLMFLTPGWEIFLAELRDNSIEINNLQDVKSEQELYFKKGQLATIGLILNHESVIERAEEEAKVEQIVDETEDI
jgi:hypothetical protein